VLGGTLALLLVGLGFVWTLSHQPEGSGAGSGGSARLAGGASPSSAPRLGSSETLPFTVTVNGPYTPTLSIAVRDLPDEPDLPTLDREPAQRDNRGFIGPDIQMPPHGNPLVDLQRSAPPPRPDGFETPIVNFTGVQSASSPPDDTGDVGPNHFLQGDNGPNGSRVTIFDKTGALLEQFYMESLAPTAPCNSGYCDPIIQYDELADRWMIAEFDNNATTLCVYVSATPDPTGQWWAYAFPRGSMQDYPKYAVWPDGYYIAANNGGTVLVLERGDMLNGQPAAIQAFNIGELPGFGFQLTVPATLEGQTPPAGSPAYYLRPRDTEIHGGTCPGCDLMEMWSLHVDWANPGNSALTSLPGVQLTDWDQTLCGTGSDWSCMSQPGTSQKLDPIREPVHYPLQYRNFGTHEVLVGCFAEDVDGLDRAAVRWFEIRSTPPGSGNWVNYQEGVIGDGVGDVHHSVCSAAMDSAGNIAVGYTRTGANAPYYPSIYYSGRRASDPLGTMPYYDIKIWDATNSNTDNERWGDYSGIGVDPADSCTFWYTTEYGGNGQTRVAAMKFDTCGMPDFTLEATPAQQSICASDAALYQVELGQISSFDQPVTLSSPGLDANLAAIFDPNPVTVPGNSILSVTSNISVTAGVYTINIQGDAITQTHAVSVELELFIQLPAAPVLLSPAAEARNVSMRPTFTWQAEQSKLYDIEVATDAGFTNLVASASGLVTASFTPGVDLPANTVLYWRVKASNPCGASLWSETSRFLTETTLGQCALGTTPNTLLTQDFEAINPESWTTGGTGSTWASSMTRKHSGTRSFKGEDINTVSDQWLISPAVVLPSGQAPAIVSFWGYRKFQPSGGFDGGVVEVSTDTGTNWTALDSQLKAGGYDGTITSATNPLYGQPAWTTPQTQWINTIANLDEFAGHTVQLRFRLGTDDSISYEGWYVDDLVVQSCSPSTSLGPDSSLTGQPGESVVHSFVLTNQSTATDSFNLSLTGNTWPTAITNGNPITLTAGQTATVNVQVDVPAGASGMSDSFTLSATSQGIPGISVFAMGETDLALEASAALSADQAAGGLAGQVIAYTFTLTNTGSYSDTFTLATSGTWLNFLPDGTSTGALGAGQSITVTVLVTIPLSALPGDSDVTVLTAASSLNGSVVVTAQAMTTVYYRNYLPVLTK
jgi:hypothetical protein